MQMKVVIANQKNATRRINTIKPIKIDSFLRRANTDTTRFCATQRRCRPFAPVHSSAIDQEKRYEACAQDSAGSNRHISSERSRVPPCVSSKLNCECDERYLYPCLLYT